MRVLATFPELGGPGIAGAPPAADPQLVPPSTCPDGIVRRPIRRSPRPAFPLGSLVVLGILAAITWTLVAIRETGPDRQPAGPRLAAEPTASGSEATR